MKNLGKRLATILVIAAMLMTMCAAAMAEGITTPSENDKANVVINGMKEGAKVTFYRIVDPMYNENGFLGYDAREVNGTKIADVTSPTQAEIETIWTALKAGTTTGLTSEGPVTVGSDGKATASVGAGTWMAIVTESGDTIYNPMIVSVNYATKDGKTVMSGADISAGTQLYLEGKNLYAKSSTPTVEKKVDGNDAISASLGEKVPYTITATRPAYPSNAVNKTFYVKDTMAAGLTLDASSIAIDGAERDGDTFKVNGEVIANLSATDRGFILAFVYDKLTADPKVTYSAVINEEAVVGGNGNTNVVDMVYANDPTKGKTWDNPNDPDNPNPPEPSEQNGLTKTEDSTTVYTYQIAFKKIGTDENAEKLAGAQFGIYSDEACTKLIDIVTTNDEGYAISSKVSEGTYYIKELAAPAGYSLNTKVYPIEALKAYANYTATVTTREYTTDSTKAVNATQVGWLLNGVFYKEKPADTAQAAYILSETTTASTVTDQGIGAGTILLDPAIPNTKVSELPSTGGMGTTLFIVGGVAVMLLAAALIGANKRRNSESK